MEEQHFLVIENPTNIDVLDENLYCYDNAVFTLTSAMQKRASDNLHRKVEQFIDSVPTIQKASNDIQSRIEYIPRYDLLSEEINKYLQEGKVEFIPCRNTSDAYYLQIRSTIKGLIVNGKEYGKNKKIKDIPLGTNNVPADVASAMQCLSMQNQLNKIANGLKEISELCELNFSRIIQGQRDDRYAKLFSSRSWFIQALAISDEHLQQQMIIQAIRDANSARAELAFQIKADVFLLNGKKANSNDMGTIVSDINKAIVYMNNAVQISLYSYQVLGERNAQLAVVKEHETFIKQVLLKEIIYDRSKHLAWNVICSSGNSSLTPKNISSLPTDLLNSCATFIENKNSTNYLEDKSND